MGYYYFDVTTPNGTEVDQIGDDLVDTAAAQVEALTLLRDLAGPFLHKGETLSVYVAVRGCNGEPVMKANLRLTVDRFEPRAA